MLVIIIKKIKEFFSSMRFSIMLTYIVVILITLLLMGIYVSSALTEKLYSSEQIDLFAKANIISELSSSVTDDIFSDDTKENIAQTLSGTDLRCIIVNPAYNVILDTGADVVNLKGKIFMRDILKTSLAGGQAHAVTENDQGSNLLSVTVPLKKGDNIAGAVYVFKTMTNIDKVISSVKMSLSLFSILIVVLIGMLSFSMSYIVTSPIDEVIKVAKEISRGNFSAKLSVRGKGEFAELKEAINYMTDELENLEQNRRKFVSDASHELKTPLATIKLICDSIVSTQNPDPQMIQEFLGDLSDEVDRLTRIVERLLTLTRLDSNKNEPTFEPVDFTVMLNAITKKLTPTANEKNINLYTDFGEALSDPALLDYDKIYEAIYNVIDNAIKYSPSGEFVKVSLANDEHWLWVTVEDNGPGIPEAEREHIFERFYRLDDSRARDTGGTGLGLAIAKESVLMHGGEISVSGTEGMGSSFLIKIPYNKNVQG